MGKKENKSVVVGKDAETDERVHEDGLLSYVDGVRTEITTGNVNRHHYGVVSDFYHTEQYGFASDSQYGVFGGQSYDASLGMVGEFHAGGKSSATIGIDVNYIFGISYDFGYSHKYTMTQGSEFSMADETEMEADKFIHLKVDPGVAKGKINKFMESYSPATAGILGFAATIPLALTTAQEGNGAHNNGMLKTTALSQYALSAVMATLASKHWRNKITKKKVPSGEFYLGPDSASLRVEGDNHSDNKTPGAARTIHLEASSDGDDKDPSIIEVIKEDKKGTIRLTVGKDGQKDSRIILKVGKSSITIGDEEIVFDSPSIEFQKGKEARVAINEDGLIVNKGDLSVNDGGAFIKKSVEAEKVVAKGVTSVSGGKLGGGPKPKTLKEYKLKNKFNLEKFESEAKERRAVLEKAKRSKDGTYML
jgi:hypothetical protein